MISLRRCNRFHLSIFFSSGWFAELQWERWAWHTGTQCNSLVRKWFFQLSNAIKIRRELSTNLVASQHKWIDFLLLRKKKLRDVGLRYYFAQSSLRPTLFPLTPCCRGKAMLEVCQRERWGCFTFLFCFAACWLAMASMRVVMLASNPILQKEYAAHS